MHSSHKQRTQHGALALDHALEHTGVGLEGLHSDLNPLGIERLGSRQTLLDVLQLVAVLGAHLGHLRHLLQHLRVRRSLQRNKKNSVDTIKLW